MTSCECGCGTEVSHGKRFRQGHYVRTNNPMSNPESRAKISGQNAPFYGRKHTDETKRKMSLRKQALVKSLSPEEIAERVERMARVVRGVKRSAEYKEKMSRRLKGIPKSPEHIEKVRQTLLRRYAIGDLVNPMTGKTLQEETRRKISEKARGRKLSDETKQKLREASTGRKRTEETCRKISEANKGRQVSEETRRKISAGNKGKKHTEEARLKMSLSRKGRTISEVGRKNIGAAKVGPKNPMYGKSSPHPKKVFYEPRGLWLRSSWEFALAQYLDSRDVDWRYEEIRYVLNDGAITYLPDFFIYEEGRLSKICEVKGWMGPDSVLRVNAFRAEYPEILLEVIGRNEFAAMGIRV